MAPDRQLQSGFSLPDLKEWFSAINTGLDLWASSAAQLGDDPATNGPVAQGPGLAPMDALGLINLGPLSHFWTAGSLDAIRGGSHSLDDDAGQMAAGFGVHVATLAATSPSAPLHTSFDETQDAGGARATLANAFGPSADRSFNSEPPVLRPIGGAAEASTFHAGEPLGQAGRPDFAFADGTIGNASSHDGGADWSVMDAKSGGGSSTGSGSVSTGGTLLTSYTSGSATVADNLEFNIKLIFSGSGWTTATENVAIWAANWLSTLVTGDTPDDTSVAPDHHFIDDLEITMTIGSIDRGGNILTGNTLAQTTLTSWRTPGTTDQYLPVEAKMKLDAYDFKTQASWWDDVLLHEMMHALGFSGNVFQGLHLLDSAGNFIGANAVKAYGAASVPIESTGGTGTAGSHWSETAFQPGGVAQPNELMTGYLTLSQPTVVSDTTVAALHDLGYQVVDPSPTANYYAVNSGLLIV